ncbi:hypothetical protein HDU76_013236, partial [Blyttiomyces sp. JEL0837]
MAPGIRKGFFGNITSPGGDVTNTTGSINSSLNTNGSDYDTDSRSMVIVSRGSSFDRDSYNVKGRNNYVNVKPGYNRNLEYQDSESVYSNDGSRGGGLLVSPTSYLDSVMEEVEMIQGLLVQAEMRVLEIDKAGKSVRGFDEDPFQTVAPLISSMDSLLTTIRSRIRYLGKDKFSHSSHSPTVTTIGGITSSFPASESATWPLLPPSIQRAVILNRQKLAKRMLVVAEMYRGVQEKMRARWRGLVRRSYIAAHGASHDESLGNSSQSSIASQSHTSSQTQQSTQSQQQNPFFSYFQFTSRTTTTTTTTITKTKSQVPVTTTLKSTASTIQQQQLRKSTTAEDLILNSSRTSDIFAQAIWTAPISPAASYSRLPLPDESSIHNETTSAIADTATSTTTSAWPGNPFAGFAWTKAKSGSQSQVDLEDGGKEESVVVTKSIDGEPVKDGKTSEGDQEKQGEVAIPSASKVNVFTQAFANLFKPLPTTLKAGSDAGENGKTVEQSGTTIGDAKADVHIEKSEESAVEETSTGGGKDKSVEESDINEVSTEVRGAESTTSTNAVPIINSTPLSTPVVTGTGQKWKQPVWFSSLFQSSVSRAQTGNASNDGVLGDEQTKDGETNEEDDGPVEKSKTDDIGSANAGPEVEQDERNITTSASNDAEAHDTQVLSEQTPPSLDPAIIPLSSDSTQHIPTSPTNESITAQTESKPNDSDTTTKWKQPAWMTAFSKFSLSKFSSQTKLTNIETEVKDETGEKIASEIDLPQELQKSDLESEKTQNDVVKSFADTSEEGGLIDQYTPDSETPIVPKKTIQESVNFETSNTLDSAEPTTSQPSESKPQTQTVWKQPAWITSAFGNFTMPKSKSVSLTDLNKVEENGSFSVEATAEDVKKTELVEETVGGKEVERSKLGSNESLVDKLNEVVSNYNVKTASVTQAEEKIDGSNENQDVDNKAAPEESAVGGRVSTTSLRQNEAGPKESLVDRLNVVVSSYKYTKAPVIEGSVDKPIETPVDVDVAGNDTSIGQGAAQDQIATSQSATTTSGNADSAVANEAQDSTLKEQTNWIMSAFFKVSGKQSSKDSTSEVSTSIQPKAPIEMSGEGGDISAEAQNTGTALPSSQGHAQDNVIATSTEAAEA